MEPTDIEGYIFLLLAAALTVLTDETNTFLLTHSLVYILLNSVYTSQKRSLFLLKWFEAFFLITDNLKKLFPHEYTYIHVWFFFFLVKLTLKLMVAVLGVGSWFFDICAACSPTLDFVLVTFQIWQCSHVFNSFANLWQRSKWTSLK